MGAPVAEELLDAVDGTELGVAVDGGGVLERTGEDGDGVCDTVDRSDGGLREIGVAELDGVGEDGRLGDFVDKMKAAVVFGGVADVEAVAAAEIPSGACGWFVVDEDAATEGADGGGIIVEGAVEVCPGRLRRVDGGLTEEVKRELGLGQELVPEELREGGIDAGQYGEEVGLERLDGTFGGVTAVDIGGDEEVLAGPVLLDDASVFGAGFVVEDLGGDGMPTHLEAVHDGIVGGDAVFVLTRLEGGLEDCIGVTVVGDHNVLVAAAGANGEATCVVCVELLDGFHPDVDFVGV